MDADTGVGLANPILSASTSNWCRAGPYFNTVDT